MTSTHTRNPGTPLDLDWVMGAHVNKSAVERRTATLTGRRTVKKDWQAAWLLRAITRWVTNLCGFGFPNTVKCRFENNSSHNFGWPFSAKI